MTALGGGTRKDQFSDYSKYEAIECGRIGTNSFPRTRMRRSWMLNLDDVVAVGNPCRVLRDVYEHDREFFCKMNGFGWENL